MLATPGNAQDLGATNDLPADDNWFGGIGPAAELLSALEGAIRELLSAADTQERVDANRNAAAYLRAALQRSGLEEAPLAIGAWRHFNLLYYADLPLRWVDDPSQVPPGGLLVLDAGRAPEGSAAGLFEPLVVPAGEGRTDFFGATVRLPRRCELRSVSLWCRAP